MENYLYCDYILEFFRLKMTFQSGILNVRVFWRNKLSLSVLNFINFVCFQQNETKEFIDSKTELRISLSKVSSFWRLFQCSLKYESFLWFFMKIINNKLTKCSIMINAAIV